MKQQIYFKKNLKYLTTNTLITQSKLAESLGVSRQAVHNIINKDSDLRLNTILKIADVYQVKPQDLIFVDLEEKLKNKKITYKLEISDNEDV